MEIPEEEIDRVFAFRSELSKETDRGCALMTGSFLENELKRLLDAILVGKKKFKKEIFDYNGPLGRVC